MQFVEKLRIFADSFGSITALADSLGIAQSSLSRYLSGEVKPGLDFIIKLKELGCDINWLLSDSPDPPPDTIKSLQARILLLEEENARLRDSIGNIYLLTQDIKMQYESKKKKKK